MLAENFKDIGNESKLIVSVDGIVIFEDTVRSVVSIPSFVDRKIILAEGPQIIDIKFGQATLIHNTIASEDRYLLVSLVQIDSLLDEIRVIELPINQEFD